MDTDGGKERSDTVSRGIGSSVWVERFPRGTNHEKQDSELDYRVVSVPLTRREVGCRDPVYPKELGGSSCSGEGVRSRIGVYTECLGQRRIAKGDDGSR